jgi:hypothetical protein
LFLIGLVFKETKPYEKNTTLFNYLLLLAAPSKLCANWCFLALYKGSFGKGNIDYEKNESVKDTLIQNKLCKKLEKQLGYISLYEPMNDLYVNPNLDTIFMYDQNSKNFQSIYLYILQPRIQVIHS